LAKAGLATSNNGHEAAVNASAATTQLQATLSQPQGTSAALSLEVGRVYERFLEMPVAFVVGVVWLAGTVFMGSCAFVLYLVVSALM
jgi:hypothetical protein